MAQIAHVDAGVITDFVVVPEGFELKGVRHADYLAACIDVPDDARLGWATADGGKTFAAPAAPMAGPVMREATGYALVMALTDDQRALYGSLKAWDQRRLSLRGSDHIPEDNPMLARVALVLKTTPKAWFDAALGAAD